MNWTKFGAGALILSMMLTLVSMGCHEHRHSHRIRFDRGGHSPGYIHYDSKRNWNRTGTHDAGRKHADRVRKPARRPDGVSRGGRRSHSPRLEAPHYQEPERRPGPGHSRRAKGS